MREIKSSTRLKKHKNFLGMRLISYLLIFFHQKSDIYQLFVKYNQKQKIHQRKWKITGTSRYIILWNTNKTINIFLGVGVVINGMKKKTCVKMFAYVNHVVFSLRISLVPRVRYQNSYSAVPNCWRSLTYFCKIYAHHQFKYVYGYVCEGVCNVLINSNSKNEQNKLMKTNNAWGKKELKWFIIHVYLFVVFLSIHSRLLVPCINHKIHNKIII